MNSRTRFVVTLATAVILTSAYWLYTATVCPWVIPPPLANPGETGGRTIIDAPIESRRMAERYLPHQPWAASARYQLRTKEAYLYFQEWNREDDDHAVRFRPFAIIWLQEGKADDEPPITAVCESAYIRFQSKFEITNNPGRAIEGALEENVMIAGPDGLWIEGETFVYNERAMRIWSDHPLRFAYGPHTGEGHGMQIELLSAPKLDPRDSVAAAGIRSIRLRRDVVMNLVGEESLDPETDGAPGDGPVAAGEPTRVFVTCSGPFEYFVEEQRAQFEKEVFVRRPTVPADDPARAEGALPELNDSLACDKLTLYFKPNDADEAQPAPADEAAPPAKRPGRFSNVESRLAFQQMTAEGKVVHVVSEENHLEATMSYLNYDGERCVAVFKDDRSVRVLRDGSEVRAPEITLVHKEEGDIESVVCRGAGWLRYFNAQTGEVDLAAQWHKQLRVFPEPDTGLSIVELEERAIVKQPREKAGMAAEFIRLWLRETDPAERALREPVAAGKPATADIPATAGERAGLAGADAPRPQSDGVPDARNNFKPVKALAVDQVAIVSPQLEAQTKRLEVWFEELSGAAPPQILPAAGRAAENRERLAPAVRQAPYGVETSARHHRPAGVGSLSSRRRERNGPQAMAAVSDPNAGQPGPSGTGTITGAATGTGTGEATENAPRRRRRTFGPTQQDGPQEPVEVIADLIRVRVVENAETGESQVAELWTEGNVNARQKLGPGEEPRRLTGDRVHFINKAENEELVHIYGKPAHVRDARMHIEGPEIHLDRGENHVWVDGAGLLQLPVERTLEGRELPQPEILDIWWKEKMTFDGRLAVFRGQVRTVNRDNRMRCEEMEVYFNRRVDFNREEEEQNEEESEPEIERVVCRDGVEVESHAYEESRLVGIRRARFWELTIHQQSGDTLASGPGWIVAWSRGNGRRAALGPDAAAQANRPLAADDSEWEYMRIDFAGRTTGNLHQRHTTFHDRVEVVYGPVEKPLATVDVDHLPRDGGWLRCDSLRFTQHEETPERPAYLELFASGNAQLEGREFHARADEITYDESKGLYVLRGLGNRQAQIWRQSAIGAEPDYTPAQQMWFIPSRNQLRFDRSTGLSVRP